MKLYILIQDGGDGSFWPHFTLSDVLIKKLEKAYDKDLMDYENGIGVDGDGFHYTSVEVPDGSTAESLGIRLMDESYADHFFSSEG